MSEIVRINHAIDHALALLERGGGKDLEAGDVTWPKTEPLKADGPIYLLTDDTAPRFAVRLMCAWVGVSFCATVGGRIDNFDRLKLMHAAEYLYQRPIYIVTRRVAA